MAESEPTLLQIGTEMPPRLMPDPPDRGATDPMIGRDLGVYRIDAFLGKGGMGKVYLAHHRDLHRPCALKILLPELARDDDDYVQRFLNEGRAAAALVHPNVVTIHACGQAESIYYLEMEFVAGRSMRQLIHDEVRLSPVRATALAAKVADGLAIAHREHIIHQDLKPDNVLMTLQGVPKLADFGLAKRLKGVVPEHPGVLCGTPNFMAPELFDGVAANAASDVYALGVTYFLALTGRFPFVGENLSGLVQAVSSQPLPDIRNFFPDVPLEVAECVSRMLDKTPANRPRDAVEASLLLYAILGDVRDLDSLIDEAFRDDPDVEAFAEGQRYRLTMRLPDGRRQMVFVEPSSHASADQLLMITSVCCPTVADYYEAALRLNSEMPHGSIAVRNVDGVPMFVVMDTYPRATVDPEEVRKSALSVASRADFIERLLTGSDRH
jgi:serine/threonine protein kinase